jgi:nitrogen-specific signal transduction histidine kinase
MVAFWRSLSGRLLILTVIFVMVAELLIFAPTRFTVCADSDQLFRAIHNLARNAAQAIENHKDGLGEIALEARRVSEKAGDERVEIDIVDTGPGVPERAKENLFKPFQGSARPGGSGLGVAIAASLVKAHGGALALVENSEAGARFRISLPQPGDTEITA